MSLKNPSLGPGIRLFVGKVPQEGNTPLSPKNVSTSLVEENVATNILI